MMKLALAIVSLAGCDLYFGQHCVSSAGAPGSETLRDPSTGDCPTFTLDSCDPSCGPCPLYNGPAIPAWPQCNGPCDNLSAAWCAMTASCHAEYSAVTSPPTFVACWNTNGALPVGPCTGLDASACAEHHDCASLMTPSAAKDGTLSFDQCIEVSTANVGPGECTGLVTCRTPPPACPTQTTPGIWNGCWTGYCIPLATCGHDAGTCKNATCASQPPACPSGTVPGVSMYDGCWTGYCIPIDQCPP
jgi:hypothetical protein